MLSLSNKPMNMLSKKERQLMTFYMIYIS